jgi:hypothetical protein
MSDEKCGNCAMALISDGPFDAATGENVKIYQCRRYPPSVISVIQQDPVSGQAVQAAQAIFPQVGANWVCGEHHTGMPVIAESASNTKNPLQG